ncbi:MAG: PRC-barrel domain-containing protein [Gammaproteobacteria bacterium]
MKTSNIVPAAALALILGAPCVAAAQQAPATSTSQSTTVTPAKTTTTTTTTTAVHYQKLDDMKVVGSNGEKIGEVSDVLIDPSSGKVVAVAVEAGGFLGIGDKDVIIGLDQLRFESGHFVTSMTKDQMKTLPEWKD